MALRLTFLALASEGKNCSQSFRPAGGRVVLRDNAHTTHATQGDFLHMTRAVIVGATSGIGREVALQLYERGWEIGIAGRRREKLEELASRDPQRIRMRVIDVREQGAPAELSALIDEMGGMDVYIHCAGVGSQNAVLNADIEMEAVRTNVAGFVRMVDAAFSYFMRAGRGHICAVTSIAGTMGLGVTPAYSAAKRFQNTYLDALEQLSHLRGRPLVFTDIRPGFVDTPFLHDGRHYPMMIAADAAARSIVEAIDRKKRTVVIDWRYRILVFFWRLVPQWLWKRLPIRTERIEP